MVNAINAAALMAIAATKNIFFVFILFVFKLLYIKGFSEHPADADTKGMAFQFGRLYGIYSWIYAFSDFVDYLNQSIVSVVEFIVSIYEEIIVEEICQSCVETACYIKNI